MRVVKPILAMAMAAGLVAMWAYRQPVVDAYTLDDETPDALRWTGVDLDVALTPLDDSPYSVVTAPDTRNDTPAVLAFAEVPAPEPDPAATTLPPPPIDVVGGDAELTGQVLGPRGPVAGATVRLQRHTVDGTGHLDVSTDRNGRWRASRMLGGRYRVRAWSSDDDLTMLASQVLYVPAGDRQALDLTIDAVDEEPQLSVTGAGDIYVGLTGWAAASVNQRSVDAEGLLVIRPVAGAIVTLEPSAEVQLVSSQAVTDAEGVARFRLRCLGAGAPVATVSLTVPGLAPAGPSRAPDGSETGQQEPPPPPPPATTTTQPWRRVEVHALPACVQPPPAPTTTTTTPVAEPAVPAEPTAEPVDGAPSTSPTSTASAGLRRGRSHG